MTTESLQNKEASLVEDFGKQLKKYRVGHITIKKKKRVGHMVARKEAKM